MDEKWARHLAEMEIEKTLRKKMADNDYVDPDRESDKYNRYWQAKNELRHFQDVGRNSPMIAERAKQIMQEAEDKRYKPITSKTGRYVIVPLLSKDSSFYTTKHIPGNGRLASDLLHPITGEILARRGYWPTNEDIGKWVNDNGIELLDYAVKPEFAAGDLSDEDRAEIDEAFGKYFGV